MNKDTCNKTIYLVNPLLDKARIRRQKVMDKLLQLRTIDNTQYQAGYRYYQDYYIANYYKMTASSVVAAASKEKRHINKLELILDARKRFDKAKGSLTKEEEAIIQWVAIKDEFLKYFDPSKRAYGVLRSGLDKLAINYRIYK